MKVAVGYLRQRRRKVEKRIYGPACRVPAPGEQLALQPEGVDELRETQDSEPDGSSRGIPESSAHD